MGVLTQASSSLEPDEDAGGMDAEALAVAKSVSLLALSGKQQAPEAGTNSKKRKRKVSAVAQHNPFERLCLGHLKAIKYQVRQ